MSKYASSKIYGRYTTGRWNRGAAVQDPPSNGVTYVTPTAHANSTTSTPKLLPALKTHNILTDTASKLMATWVKDPEIKADLYVAAHHYTSLLKWFTGGESNEVGGWFAINSERRVTRLFKTDTGRGASVDFSVEMLNDVSNKLRETNEFVAGNWHTHPGFGPFWSTTDNEMMLALAEDDLSILGQTDMTFLVFDPPYHMVRRVIGKEADSQRTMNYNDGLLWLDGADEALPEQAPKRVYVTSTYGSAYKQSYGWKSWDDEADDYLWDKAPAYKSPSIPARRVDEAAIAILEGAAAASDVLTLYQILLKVNVETFQHYIERHPGSLKQFSDIIGVDL